MPGSAIDDEADAATLRAETIERLKAYEPTGPTATASAKAPATSPSQPAPPASTGDTATLSSPASDRAAKKSLPSLLQYRIRLLNEYDECNMALQKALHPEPTPAQQAAEARGELDRLRTILSQTPQATEALLPPPFRGTSVKASNPLGSEMKDAIETTANELKDWKTRLETLRSEIASWNSRMNLRRTSRDSLFQHVTALSARSTEFKSAVTDALTAADRRLANERLVNFQWELRVESLRLRVLEAQLALEGKLTEVRDIRADVCRAHIQVANRLLEAMQKHYKVIADDQERDLSQARDTEENKARLSTDPLEQFRARRTAELLALEALVVKNEQALVLSPEPSYEEQKTLADRADFDFANIKELLEDGNVSRLDAVRLNNEFRRIGPERDGLLKKEMAQVESQLQYYENTLTSVELDLLQHSLHDRFDHDLLRDSLPAARRADGEALAKELEVKRKSLLYRRRRALEKLSEGASHTLVQVTRRLGILDQEYGFIRTTIFWVRDQEPIGLFTLTQGAREFNVLVKGVLRLVQETVTPKLWSEPSGEFMAIGVGVLVLPVAMMRLRRVLGEQLKRDLPAA